MKKSPHCVAGSSTHLQLFLLTVITFSCLCLLLILEKQHFQRFWTLWTLFYFS